MSTVSFILPAFKRGYLREAIASILAQTYKDFELVVVDDASPEDLKSVVIQFDDRRLSYHRNDENMGYNNLVSSWNHAIGYARGEYLVLASDDDVYAPDFLEKLLCLAKKYPDVDIFTGRYVRMANGHITGMVAKPAEYESQVECMYAMVCENRYPIAPNVMVRTASLKKIGGFVNLPAGSFADYLTWLKLAKNGSVNSSGVLLQWRFDGTNITTSQNTHWDRQKWLGVIKAQSLFIEQCQALVPKNDIEAYQKADILKKVTEEYDSRFIVRFIQGATFKEFSSFYWKEVRGNKLTLLIFLKIMLKRIIHEIR